MSKSLTITIADEHSPPEKAGKATYRFTDEDGTSAERVVPDQHQAAAKALFALGEQDAVSDVKAEAEAKASRMADRMAALDARLNQ